jgi:hypothetical protein
MIGFASFDLSLQLHSFPFLMQIADNNNGVVCIP